MRKIISILMATAILVGVLGTTAFAASTNSNKAASQATRAQEQAAQKQERATQRQAQIAEKQAQMEQNRAQFKTKTDEYKAYKKGLAQKRSELMGNKGLSLDVLTENRELRAQLSAAMQAVEDSEEALSQETSDALAGFNAQIKELAAQMRATQGNIRDLLKQNRELIKAKDYVAMDLVYEQIADIQLTRTEQLKEINNLLIQMIELL